MLFGGGSSSGMLDFISETQDSVKVVVEDQDRRKDALGTVKALEKRVDAHNKAVGRYSKAMSSAISDADTDEMDIALDEYFAQRSSYNSDMLDLRFELKDQLSREEWQQIFPEE